MTILRTPYWLAIWLLSPIDRMPLLKSICTGFTLGALSLLSVPALFVVGFDRDRIPLLDESPPPLSPADIVQALLVNPVLNIMVMVLVFDFLGVFRALTPHVCAVLLLTFISGAYGINDVWLLTTGFMGVALITQYTLHRDHLQPLPAATCVALTSSAANMSILLLTLILR